MSKNTYFLAWSSRVDQLRSRPWLTGFPSWIVQCLVVAQTRGVWMASEGPWILEKSLGGFVHTDRVCDFCWIFKNG